MGRVGNRLEGLALRRVSAIVHRLVADFGVARRQKIPPKSHGFHDSVDLLRSTGEQTTVPPTVSPCRSSCDATKRLNFSCSVDIQQAFSISPVNLVLVIRRKLQPLDDADRLTALQTLM